MDGVTGGDVELLSKMLQVEHKLFYFDLKENPRGRYLKISEKTTASRSTIIVPESGIGWFVNLFSQYANNGDKLPSNACSRELQMDTKAFYFDIGENPRGRFLKVSEASNSSVRSTIIVPSGNDEDGWVQFRDVLAQIHESVQLMVPSADGRVPPQLTPPSELSTAGFYGNGPTRNASAAPAVSNESTGARSTAKVLRAEQKKFFFDLGSNSRGQYLRISEVIGSDRSAIILPASALEQFHDMIGQFVKVLKTKESDAATAAAAAVASLKL